MPIDLDRLKANLLTSGLQIKDKALFQVIDQLIQSVREHVGVLTVATGSGTAGLATKSYITKNDDTGILPNSIRLVAGDNVSFDDSVSHQRTINAVSKQWSVLTDGDLIEPELIFAGGDVIMTHVP